MKLNINKLRLWRNICSPVDVSFGAMGVLAYMFFGEHKNMTIEAIKNNGPDSLEKVQDYVNELIEEGYLDNE